MFFCKFSSPEMQKEYKVKQPLSPDTNKVILAATVKKKIHAGTLNWGRYLFLKFIKNFVGGKRSGKIRTCFTCARPSSCDSRGSPSGHKVRSELKTPPAPACDTSLEN